MSRNIKKNCILLLNKNCHYILGQSGAQFLFFFFFFFLQSSGGCSKIRLKHPHFPRTKSHVECQFNPTLPLQQAAHTAPTRRAWACRPDLIPERSGAVEIRRHSDTPSSPGSVGLARDHPLTKTQAVEPSRRTLPSYGLPYPLGRYSSVWLGSHVRLQNSLLHLGHGREVVTGFL